MRNYAKLNELKQRYKQALAQYSSQKAQLHKLMKRQSPNNNQSDLQRSAAILGFGGKEQTNGAG